MIPRNPSLAAGQAFDLIVVGGGFYGASLALESARRGLKPLLLEAGDFGHATSWNSLRIVHGGLRYLQSLDLRRFFESVHERKWFLRHFPDLVHPLPCMMPLYGDGVYRSAIFRAALQLNDILSRGRNDGVPPQNALGPGRILDAAETAAAFPEVERDGLQGAAYWLDGAMPDSQRVLIEMLHWAAEAGATSLNYVRAEQLIASGAQTEGVVGRDTLSGTALEFRAPVVVNCGGPWCREIASALDRDVPRLFSPAVAFNLLLDYKPNFKAAVAVRPRLPGARSYFLYPWKGLLLAGTYHASCPRGFQDGAPGEDLVADFVKHLGVAIPGSQLTSSHVLRVHWGFLPARSEGSWEPSHREVLHCHGDDGGTKGLYSVSGVKLTTARLVAEKMLRRIVSDSGKQLPQPLVDRPRQSTPSPGRSEFETLLRNDRQGAQELVHKIIDQEAVVCWDDLLLRRTDWGSSPIGIEMLRAELQDIVQRALSPPRAVALPTSEHSLRH
jgi:glycerol-3-phosphate dehydrogenase